MGCDGNGPQEADGKIVNGRHSGYNDELRALFLLRARSTYPFTSAIAFSRAAMILSHHSSNSGSSI